MYKLKREYPLLLRIVEKSAHSKFKRRPTLIICKGGRPREDCQRIQHGKRVVGVAKARVFIPRRLARENKPLARLAVIHELRENLAFQNGQPKSKTHGIARRITRACVRRLRLSKSAGHLLSDFYRRR